MKNEMTNRKKQKRKNIFKKNLYHPMQGKKAIQIQGITECGIIRNIKREKTSQKDSRQ